MCHIMSLLGRVAVRRARKAALLCVVFLMVRAWSSASLALAGVAAAAPGSQGCPPQCSCSSQQGKVVCTRRGLTRVPPGIPANTRHLNLMENAIEAVQADSFRHLHHLEVLQLGRNAIRQIEVGAFNGLTSLNTLELFDNRLTVVPSGAFEYLSKLRELWLRNNPIESIPSYAFNRVPSLMRLDLGELRKLEYISEGAFEGLQNLKYLNLGMCNIRGDMPNLGPLKGLEELEISENLFPEIKPGSFRGLRSLKKLWVMNSQVTVIERNAFDDLASLVELNLAHNNLSALPHELFSPLKYLVELHLHHNPWNCGCEAVWLARWLREYIPTNSTCCGRCHSPASMRGRQLVEVDRGEGSEFQCSAPFIADAPRDFNISAERVAELRCRTAPMSSVRWLLPNGTVLTHASSNPRISVLNDGTLNFSNVLAADTGTYTCMVSNAAGNSNASAYLNVSAAELNTSNLSYFTTVTVEIMGPTTEMPKPKPTSAAGVVGAGVAGGGGQGTTTTTASPSVFQPVFISTPTVLLQSTESPPGTARPSAVPGPKGATGKPAKSGPSLDEVMKTTKIIIGCFVAVTLLAAVMLIAFYKLRKRHQQRSTVGAARTVEIIQVDEEDLPPPASAAQEAALALPEIRDHNSIHKLDFISHKTDYGFHKPKADYKPQPDFTLHKPKAEYTTYRPTMDFNTHKSPSDYSTHKSTPDFSLHRPKADYSPFRPEYSTHKPKAEYSPLKPDFGTHPKARTDYSPFKADFSTHPRQKSDFSPFKRDYSTQPKPKHDYSPLKSDYSTQPKPKSDYSPFKTDYGTHPRPKPEYSPFKPDYSTQPKTKMDYSNQRPKPDSSGYKTKDPYTPHKTTADYSAFKMDFSPHKADYNIFKSDFNPHTHRPKVDYSPHKMDYSPHKMDYSPNKVDYSTLKPKYNTYKPTGQGAKWTENNVGNSLPRTLPSTITAMAEPFVIKTHTKEKVQETQI